MLRSILIGFLLFSASLASSQTPSHKDIDISASDGTNLRATFFSAGKPGPGVLLFHMCNTTRRSWEPVAVGLSQAGINALTIDNRGFGESGGPRFDQGTPEVKKELNDQWPADFDVAYQFFVSQTGVDKTRIAAGGGSCGMTNAVKLAEQHPDVKALVLLAGATDVKGIDFIADHPQIPIFTAAAADDEFNPQTLQIMKWYRDLSGDPRSKFSGFKDGRHGTEIFGPHPELVKQIVAFLVDTLVTSPADPKAPVIPRKTPASELWALANQPGGAIKAAKALQDGRKKDPNSYAFAEFAINLLGYARLQEGNAEEGIELFKLNTQEYPASANAQDSLSDGYLAAGKKDLARAAEEKCLELLPNDPSNADFKDLLGKQAREKIAKLKGEQK